ncbi:Aldehyde oxidase GLOX1 [Linum perenne]
MAKMKKDRFLKALILMPLLLVTAYGTMDELFKRPRDFSVLNQKQVMGPHELFGDPFGNPNAYKSEKIPGDVGTPMDGDLEHVEEITKKAEKEEKAADSEKADQPAEATDSNVLFTTNMVERGGADKNMAAKMATRFKGKLNANLETPLVNPGGYNGVWEIFSNNSGVSAMHSILLPKVENVLMYDSTIWRISNILLPNGICRVLDPKTGEKDCYAHSVWFDTHINNLVPLELKTDTWCSSGGLTLEGNFVSTGGYQGGANTVRYLDTCPGCTWREYPTALSAPRWYSTQAQLADGRFIVVGGRDAQSFEYIPPEGKNNEKPFFLDILKQTLDPEENNLYPFVFLSTDSNVFIFANNRSVLLNPNTNTIVKEFPVLPGGHRNYPASGMSVILPLDLNDPTTAASPIIPSEIMVCGGSAHIDSYGKASQGIYYETLADCGRLRITDPNPVWERDLMPTPRIMGDMMLLPSGDILIVNGAMRGASGWGFAREPNFTPVLYTPGAKFGTRFRQLAPSTIPRMYHSSTVVLPDSRVMISGSNTNNGYIYNAMFPTELRVEKFSPPYLDPALLINRPEILNGEAIAKFGYKAKITIQVKLNPTLPAMVAMNLKVSISVPGFSTHGVTMNQRQIMLGLDSAKPTAGKEGIYDLVATTPPSSAVAPTGYYMLSVVYQGIPSKAVWVQLK